jgi:Fe2+ or Zn2+ uptake regulation protein
MDILIINGARVVPDEPDEVSAILAEQILRYLAAYPNAVDSREGIERWWLQDVGSSFGPQAVQAALDLLVSQQHLNKVVLAGGQVIYSRVADN